MANILTCLVCGVESEVNNIPLDTIREASIRAETLLCDKLSWSDGIKAVSDCQVGLPGQQSFTKFPFFSFSQFEFDKYLVAPCIELYNTQIAIWRAMVRNIFSL